MKATLRAAAALALAATLVINLACAFKSSDVAAWADRGSRWSQMAADKVQSYVDAGSINREKGEELVARLKQISSDSKILADAFRNGATNTVELTANLITAFERIIDYDINLIPPGAKRTAVMVFLEVVDEVLHHIADRLVQTADALHHHVLYSKLVQQAEKTAAAKKIREFSKKPRLRCRDAKTGRFQKMEVCKVHPDTTVVERVK